MEKVKLTANILFSGIGCQEEGIKNSGVFDLEVISTSEINKEAILSYAIIHNNLNQEMINNYDSYPSVEEMIRELSEKNIGYIPEKKACYNWGKHKGKSQEIIKKYWLANHLNHNLGDISKINSLPYADLWTVSFPCQSISCAGKMKGFKPDSGTRSSLLWENIRLLKEAVNQKISPKYILFENVKNLVGKKFYPDFLTLIDILADLGYNFYWQVLNAKDCGIPQNRERVFVICIRKDIDNGTYTFPLPFESKIRLKDIFDESVTEEYYVENKRAKVLIEKFKKEGLPLVINTNKAIKVGNVSSEYSQAGSVFDEDGLFPTICAGTHGYALGYVLEKEKNIIRQLTVEECFALMGMKKEYVKNCKQLNLSKTALYKQAGNGIVSDCVELLAEHLYKAQYNGNFECKDERLEEGVK